jgi:hypothetical protein
MLPREYFSHWFDFFPNYNIHEEWQVEQWFENAMFQSTQFVVNLGGNASVWKNSKVDIGLIDGEAYQMGSWVSADHYILGNYVYTNTALATTGLSAVLHVTNPVYNHQINQNATNYVDRSFELYGKTKFEYFDHDLGPIIHKNCFGMTDKNGAEIVIMKVGKPGYFEIYFEDNPDNKFPDFEFDGWTWFQRSLFNKTIFRACDLEDTAKASDSQYYIRNILCGFIDKDFDMENITFPVNGLEFGFQIYYDPADEGKFTYKNYLDYEYNPTTLRILKQVEFQVFQVNDGINDILISSEEPMPGAPFFGFEVLMKDKFGDLLPNGFWDTVSFLDLYNKKFVVYFDIAAPGVTDEAIDLTNASSQIIWSVLSQPPKIFTNPWANLHYKDTHQEFLPFGEEESFSPVNFTRHFNRYYDLPFPSIQGRKFMDGSNLTFKFLSHLDVNHYTIFNDGFPKLFQEKLNRQMLVPYLNSIRDSKVIISPDIGANASWEDHKYGMSLFDTEKKDFGVVRTKTPAVYKGTYAFDNYNIELLAPLINRPIHIEIEFSENEMKLDPRTRFSNYTFYATSVGNEFYDGHILFPNLYAGEYTRKFFLGITKKSFDITNPNLSLVLEGLFVEDEYTAYYIVNGIARITFSSDNKIVDVLFKSALPPEPEINTLGTLQSVLDYSLGSFGYLNIVTVLGSALLDHEYDFSDINALIPEDFIPINTFDTKYVFFLDHYTGFPEGTFIGTSSNKLIDYSLYLTNPPDSYGYGLAGITVPFLSMYCYPALPEALELGGPVPGECPPLSVAVNSNSVPAAGLE